MPESEWVLLVRYSEIHLKGLNKPFFERKLIEAIKAVLSDMDVVIKKAQGRVYVHGLALTDIELAISRLKKVFGIHSVSPALAVDATWNTIVEAAYTLFADALKEKSSASFKVIARRADKSFALSSDEINRQLGGLLITRFPELFVDVHTPNIRLGVEIRERAFLYIREARCAGGMPVGSSGQAALLLSGGIDSPVAGFLVAKRGVTLCAIHFLSPPYTSERARDKVEALTKILSAYTGQIRLHLVPFTQIQLLIHENCRPNETVLLMRRMMMRIAERIAASEGALALVTGEAIGQVASQTMESLVVTNEVVKMPVLRPLIGFDKQEIIEYAKAIGSYETSILPYEDCCTVFVPRHPLTRPVLSKLVESEAQFDYNKAIEDALNNTKVVTINRHLDYSPQA